ncbi:MAG: sulfatase-like hydrolase/transferase [Candidatus Hydrogenedentes bacterium]|nr:sulfatase-like hydrolase/transferase [Candidatus Hydrogenedentota bacterium]
MILVYAITLGMSSGVAGLFARQALGEQGYVPGLTPGVMVACGVAAVYAGLQLLYVGAIRFCWPTKTNSALFFECLSHGAALLFIAYFAHINLASAVMRLFDIAGLIPRSENADWQSIRFLAILTALNTPLYLVAFLAIHSSIKVVGFYAILRSPAGPRAWNVMWIVAALPLILIGGLLCKAWLGSVEEARPRAPENSEVFRAGTAYASARALPEGSVLTVNATATLGNVLKFACANPPDIALEDELEVAYLTVEMRGETTAQYNGPVELSEDGWSYFSVPADKVPRKMDSCQVRWSTEKESKWRKAVGVLPVLTSERKLLVAGPNVCSAPSDESAPSIVMIVFDGLGSDRVSSMGSVKETTPNLDRLAESALTYPFTYTPAPESAAACMTLLTGVSPLRHGFLGAQSGPLPETYKTLAEALRAERYATAAFTEGEKWGDLAHGNGFERGFDLYDDGYAEGTQASVTQADQKATATGSQQTLQKAGDWIGAHGDARFFAFVRVSELRDPQTRAKYAAAGDTTSAAATTAYNTAIQQLDRSVAGLVARAKAASPDKKICVVISSARGSYLADTTVLADWTLRVPFILAAPGVAPAKRNELASLEDVASTIAKYLHVTLAPLASTADLINAPIAREPISMVGNPLVLSVRNANMRLVWSTQREPFTMRSAGLPATAALYDLRKSKPGAMFDISRNNPQTTKNWTDKLDQYFMMQCEGWQADATVAK